MSKDIEASPLQIRWIVWGAMLVTHFVFLVMGALTHQEVEPDPATIDMMAYVLTGVGVVTALGSVLVMPKVIASADLFSALIVRWATAEAVSIFGLVLAMMGADMMWTYMLTGLGVLALLAAAPTDRECEAHEQRRAAASKSR